ncbi:MAG: hypothetical protein ACT4P9_00035 [Betaproteobacteria bacterium]
MKLIQRILAALIALAIFAAALVFASIALGVILAIALIAWAWLTWRGRSRRPGPGVVVEGEVRRTVVVERIEKRDPP